MATIIATSTGPVEVSDVVVAMEELRRRKAAAVARVLSSQLRRIDQLWAKYESTGDPAWLEAAVAADEFYRRLRARSVAS